MVCNNYAVFELVGEGNWEQVTHWIELQSAESHMKHDYLKGKHLQIFMRVV